MADQGEVDSIIYAESEKEEKEESGGSSSSSSSKKPRPPSRRFTELNLKEYEERDQAQQETEEAPETEAIFEADQGDEEHIPELIKEFQSENKKLNSIDAKFDLNLVYGEKVLFHYPCLNRRVNGKEDFISLVGEFYGTNYKIIFVPTGVQEMDKKQSKQIMRSLVSLGDVGVPAEKDLGKYLIDIPYTRIHNLKRTKHYFNLLCKDGFSTDFFFEEETDAKETSEKIAFRVLPDHCIKVFAFLHRPSDYKSCDIFDLGRELKRVGFPTENCVIDSNINSNFKFCSTYPSLLVIPKKADPDLLHHVAKFRSRNRIPVGTYFYAPTGATLYRSSQPLVGMGRRSKQDEFYTGLLRNEGQKNMIVLDSRPKTNAHANRLAGGGYESKKYNANVIFQDIENIHVVRNALLALRNAYEEDSREKLQSAESAWLRLCSIILTSAKEVVEQMVNKNRSVLVHCSDGWDRTAQSIALAELVMDPYYRTIVGFAVLVEKEFGSYGHQFARRHGHGFNIQNPRDSQRSPIFTQFIHCVVQLLRQFPTSFEFNEDLMLFMLDAVYSCRFGNFLFDNDRLRAKADVRGKTVSVWSMVMVNIATFQNPMYTPNDGLLDLKLFRTNALSMISWKEYHKNILQGNTRIRDLALTDPFSLNDDGANDKSVGLSVSGSEAKGKEEDSSSTGSAWMSRAPSKGGDRSPREGLLGSQSPDTARGKVKESRKEKKGSRKEKKGSRKEKKNLDENGAE